MHLISLNAKDSKGLSSRAFKTNTKRFEQVRSRSNALLDANYLALLHVLNLFTKSAPMLATSDGNADELVDAAELRINT